MPGPVVETGPAVVLRAVERDDAAFLQRLYADPWARMGMHEHGHKSEDEVEAIIEDQFEDDANAAYLACVDDEDAPWGRPEEDETTPVAFVFASHVDRDRPHVVHWVSPAHRGEGYGEAALELAVDTVFRTYDVHSLAAAVPDGDDATRERVEALGFVHEGANREMQFVEGAYRDVHQYGLLRREWEGE
jgi:RimJ/RimL family protein N-acetyltransferase